MVARERHAEREDDASIVIGRGHHDNGIARLGRAVGARGGPVFEIDERHVAILPRRLGAECHPHRVALTGHEPHVVDIEAEVAGNDGGLGGADVGVTGATRKSGGVHDAAKAHRNRDQRIGAHWPVVRDGARRLLGGRGGRDTEEKGAAEQERAQGATRRDLERHGDV